MNAELNKSPPMNQTIWKTPNLLKSQQIGGREKTTFINTMKKWK